MKLNCVEESLSSLLKILGWKIAKHPVYFILFPCILSIILGTGILNISYNRDFEYLGVSQTGRAANNKKIVESLYPENNSLIDFGRMNDYPMGPIINILSKDSKNMFREDIFKELDQLDKIVQTVRVNSEGRKIGYSELCIKTDGRCFENPLIKLIKRSREIVSKKDRIKYPVDIKLLSYEPYLLNLGGVTVDENNYIEEVKVFRLFYITERRNTLLINEWENSVIEEISQKKFDNITVIPFAFSHMMENVKKFTEISAFVAGKIAAFIVLFSILSCMTNNWVRSKPWLGLSACISAGLSLITSFGTMSYIGIDSNDANICICFLVLGTEIDDAYILIAAWRTTNSQDTVEKRMGDTFKEAAISITITSTTNVLSLCIGLVLPFPVVKLFCAYAAVSMFFAYIYQITFFGGCMALDGYREKKCLHPFTFREMPGGFTSLEEDKLMNLFKNKIGGMLVHTSVRAVVLIAFVGNLFVGIWGLFLLYNGVDPRTLLSENSHAFKSVDVYFQYFGQYPGSMQIIINQTLNYENPEVQKSIEDMLHNFTSHPNIASSEFTLDWLKYYKTFLNKPIGKFLMHGYNVSEKKDFIDGLKNVFLRLRGANDFAFDIIFNENETEIVCTRFIVLLKDIYDKETQKNVLKDVWRLSDESKLSLTLHSLDFPLVEQGIIIREMTVQVTWITAVLIMIVFCLFIPEPITTLFVSLVIVSTIIETAGYMAFWNIDLDMGTITIIILCVGFSVNYPSHVAYAFAKSKQKTSNGRLKNSLYHVGLPILQGSLSTILAVSVLAFNPVRAYVVFFTIVFLIALLTTFHAMFVLPVFLNISGGITFSKQIPNRFALFTLRMQPQSSKQ